MYNESPLTTIQIRQGPFARPALPGVVTTMNPSDSRTWPQHGYWFPWSVVSPVSTLATPRRASQVLDCSVGIRRPLSPRRARPLRMFVASRSMSGFALSGGLATLAWCNEAEMGSLTLRLTPSPSEASERGIAPTSARSTTWRTNNFHGQYLSTNKNNQASPDAPDEHGFFSDILRIPQKHTTHLPLRLGVLGVLAVPSVFNLCFICGYENVANQQKRIHSTTKGFARS